MKTGFPSPRHCSERATEQKTFPINLSLLTVTAEGSGSVECSVSRELMGTWSTQVTSMNSDKQVNVEEAPFADPSLKRV